MKQTKIAAGDKVPVGQKLAYAAGGSVEMLSGASVGTMWMPVFNLGFRYWGQSKISDRVR